MPQVIPLRDVESLDAYYLAWKALLGSTVRGTFAQSPEYWRALFADRAEGAPLILVVKHGLETLGIVPLLQQRGTLNGGPLCPALSWRPVGRQPTVTMLAAWQWLVTEYDNWQTLDLGCVDLPEADRGRTLNTLRQAGMEPDVQWRTHGAVSLNRPWFEYLASRERGLRNDVRWAEHKLSLQGKLSLVRHRPAGKLRGDADPRWELYDACVQIRAPSSSHNIPSPLVHEAAVDAGALDLAVLMLGGQPLAYSYGVVSDNRLQVIARGTVASVTPSLDSGLNLDCLFLWYLLADSMRQGDLSVELGLVDHVSRDWVTEKQVAESYRFGRRPRWFPTLFAPHLWESWTRA